MVKVGRPKAELKKTSPQAVRDAILDILSTSKESAVTGEDLLSATRNRLNYPELPAPRFWDVVLELREEGLVEARRRLGYWKIPVRKGASEEDIQKAVATDIEQEVPEKRSKRESDYYEYLARWAENAFRCVAEVVSEKGKRGRKRTGKLAAVPDIVGIRYIPGPNTDDVELLAMEVKVGAPQSGDLSEAYRYSRFADYCYLAYDEDGLSDRKTRYELIAECRRLGLGLIRFPSYRRQGKATQELLSPMRQNPSLIGKEEYLARVLDMYRCTYCGTFHNREEGKLVSRSRSDILAPGALEATRFVCEKCLVRA
jgi:hypothetical protein